MIASLLLVTVLHADPMAGDWVAHRSLASFSSPMECHARALSWAEVYQGHVDRARDAGAMLETKVTYECSTL